jgi:hypothetical protein
MRDAWVGIVLPTLGRNTGPLAGVHTGLKVERTGGYRVDAETAFRLLSEHNERAFNVWVNDTPTSVEELIFSDDCCELMPS